MRPTCKFSSDSKVDLTVTTDNVGNFCFPCDNLLAANPKNIIFYITVLYAHMAPCCYSRNGQLKRKEGGEATLYCTIMIVNLVVHHSFLIVNKKITAPMHRCGAKR